jgi:nucleotide-binding universal stress UspA family protein
MLKQILVPLDGSELSERILTRVHTLLFAEGTEVKLIRVLSEREVERAAQSGPDVVDVAQTELSRVAAMLADAGAAVSHEILFGDPAEQILAFADGYRPALIAMSTHGRSGISRWVRGSVAERILRHAPFPILFANPAGIRATPAFEAPSGDEDLARELAFHAILVPLDGSERSASILPLVADVAKTYSSRVTLLHVVENEVPLGPAPDFEPLRARLPGVPVAIRAVSGTPAETILDVAANELFDLVAMTTHGRSGVARWALGSVAERVMRSCSTPLLVKRTAGVGVSDAPRH